jgi:hypothetical protein
MIDSDGEKGGNCENYGNKFSCGLRFGSSGLRVPTSWYTAFVELACTCTRLPCTHNHLTFQGIGRPLIMIQPRAECTGYSVWPLEE